MNTINTGDKVIINLVLDDLPLPACDSADPRRRHHGEEFTPLVASFVERNGFVTVTDKSLHVEMKLPMWIPSPSLSIPSK